MSNFRTILALRAEQQAAAVERLVRYLHNRFHIGSIADIFTLLINDDFGKDRIKEILNKPVLTMVSDDNKKFFKDHYGYGHEETLTDAALRCGSPADCHTIRIYGGKLSKVIYEDMPNMESMINLSKASNNIFAFMYENYKIIHSENFPEINEHEEKRPTPEKQLRKNHLESLEKNRTAPSRHHSNC